MKKREITLHWDEYEIDDLVRPINKKDHLEEGVTYKVVDFLLQRAPQYNPTSRKLHGSVGLRDEEDEYRVTDTKNIRPANWWVEVRIDETRYWHWDILDAILGKEGKVYGVYTYNEMEHTYCCEARPSYFLRYVYDYPSVMLPEKMMDEFDNHANVDSNEHYVHVTDVEAMSANDKCDLGIFGCLGETSEEIEEQVLEHIQGNPNWC